MERFNEQTKKIIADIMDLVRIPSILSEKKSEEAPFGENVKKCLDEILRKGQDMGFVTRNIDGYVGEMDMGNGPDLIGILCHSDVVAAGEGWNTEPFEPQVIDGKLYGRGSSDDKGPLVVCMHAVKKLMDDGKIPANVTIRIIVGTNEEEDWDDMKHYKRVRKEFPRYSIIPDGMFPLIYCEKGLYDVNFVYHGNSCASPDAEVELISIEGGLARNVVPARAQAKLRAAADQVESVSASISEVIEAQGVDGKVACGGNIVTVSVTGKSAHAMNPEKGVNAISQLMGLLGSFPKLSFSHQQLVDSYNARIGMDHTGAASSCDCSDAESGSLTFNIGTIAMKDDGVIELAASIRYPASFAFEDIEKKVADGFAESAFDVVFADHMLPVYFEQDDKFVELLMGVYARMTKDSAAEPIAIGGATYARALPNAVAFGPVFPDEKELAHEPNEYVSIEKLLLAGEIYYEALSEICRMEWE